MSRWGIANRAVAGGRMDENICEQCGTRNEPGAQFCVECQSFLPWEDTQEVDARARLAAVADSAAAAQTTAPDPIVEVGAPSEPDVAAHSATPPVADPAPDTTARPVVAAASGQT